MPLKRGIEPAPKPQDFAAAAGQGVRGRVDGVTLSMRATAACWSAQGVHAGRTGQAEADRLAEEGKTPLFFVREARAAACMGLIAVADVVKPTSRQAIAELKKHGH